MAHRDLNARCGVFKWNVHVRTMFLAVYVDIGELEELCACMTRCGGGLGDDITYIFIVAIESEGI